MRLLRAAADRTRHSEAEEELETRWPEARVSRLDQDSARQRGSASKVLDAVHNGDVDILIGTQIVAKGHDFKNVGWWLC